jgi:hypothetical protein
MHSATIVQSAAPRLRLKKTTMRISIFIVRERCRLLFKPSKHTSPLQSTSSQELKSTTSTVRGSTDPSMVTELSTIVSRFGFTSSQLLFHLRFTSSQLQYHLRFTSSQLQCNSSHLKATPSQLNSGPSHFGPTSKHPSTRLTSLAPLAPLTASAPESATSFVATISKPNRMRWMTFFGRRPWVGIAWNMTGDSGHVGVGIRSSRLSGLMSIRTKCSS